MGTMLRFNDALFLLFKGSFYYLQGAYSSVLWRYSLTPFIERQE